MKTNPLSVVAYIRVSTEEQANEGVSIAAQEARIRSYCELKGLELAAVVIDAGVSGYKVLEEREGGRRVQALVRGRKVAGVVALKLDRLFRNASDCLEVCGAWDKVGAALHLLDLGGEAVDTSSAIGRFFLTVMAGAAELERNQIAERTSMAMQHMRSQGQYTGGRVPFGYVLDESGELVEHFGEQQVVARARELRASGLSLRSVAAELESAGMHSRAGKPFTAQAVQNMTEQGAAAA